MLFCVSGCAIGSIHSRFVEGETAIEKLLARNTYHTFDYGELFTMFFVYFPLAAWFVAV